MKKEKTNGKVTRRNGNGSGIAKRAAKPPLMNENFLPETVMDVAEATEKTMAQPEPETAPAKVVVEARIDVGLGNQLFIRGSGPGLSWEQGVPLGCVDATTWRWATQAAEPVTFKLLLNDQLWCQGADLQATPGSVIEVAPAF